MGNRQVFALLEEFQGVLHSLIVMGEHDNQFWFH
jgi:hypothetical protein